MNNKNIWYINETAGSPEHGMVFRQYYFSKQFVQQGFNVTLISSTFSHLFKKLPNDSFNYNKEIIEGINYLWLKVPKYKESKDKKRIFKWFVFMYRLFRLDTKKMTKPDVIIFSCTTPFSFLPAYWLSKKLKSKIFFEIRDIWPLSPIALGGHSPKHPLMAMMAWFEKFAMKKADEIVSNLPNYSAHLKNRGVDKEFNWISNGVFLEELNNIQALTKEVKNQIPDDKFIIGFTGTVGNANGMNVFCEVAEKLKENKEILFVIVGEGENRAEIETKYGKLPNLKFLDFIPKNQVQSMLSLFDVCYIGLKKQKLFEFGVSPNKLFDYMYSAKPILYAINSE